MKTYKIWFATNPTFWGDDVDIERKMVAEIQAQGLEHVWRICQNGNELGWEEKGLRSMSVGDVAEVDGEYHFVDMVGFKQIDKPSL
jgi:hypothetical protein